MKKGNLYFVTAAVLNFMIAALHIVILFIGASAYRYFGAGEEMAKADEEGSLFPAITTLLVTVFFFVFGLYALTAADKFRRLPFTRAVLVFITIIFLMRGLGVLGDVWGMTHDPAYPVQMVWFSFASLVTGICYLMGLKKKWAVL